ncbi:MAG: hypothetical protein KF709_06665 [Gemmatimonadaceae bacterium]|nr:hypothetical protein [Gemmatimonadaceae bacterium]
MRRLSTVVALALVGTMPLNAQSHDHATHAAAAPATPAAAPREGGQAAFAAIAEIVRMLDADPNTDWSQVNIEALRQHLIDMDEVTMRATVRSDAIDGGAAFLVLGAGRTLEAIRRMTASRAATGTPDGSVVMTATPVDGGVRFTAVAGNPRDARAVARIRGLGFIGVVALGDHHAPHHLGIANGSMTGTHGH